MSNKGCKCKAVLEPCHFCSCDSREVFDNGKTFTASKIFTNALQGCNHKLLMALMVDITLFVSSFSIYVILLTLNVLLASLLAVQIGPKFKSILTTMQHVLTLIVDLVEQPPNTTSHVDPHVLYVVGDWSRQATAVMM